MINNDNSAGSAEHFATFHKIWLETVMKIMQVGCTITPTSPPPEVFRHVRTGILEALAESWDQFLRSPQFLEAMKQWTDQTVALRRMSDELLGRLRHEIQAPSRDDIDTVMLAVRHMEKRLLDRMEQLSAQVSELGNSRDDSRPGPAPRRKAGAKTRGAGSTPLTPAEGRKV